MDLSSPLAKYAAEHWIIHAHSGCKNKSQSSLVSTLIMKLLTDENGAFVRWVEIYNIDRHHVNLQKHMLDIAKPLYYASLAGLTEASYALVEMGADVNAQGGDYGNALQAASFGGHEAIAMLLIAKGANISTQGGDFGNALQAALYGGHKGIAKLLIDNGADLNAWVGDSGNALYAASYEGHEAIAKLLIDNGADVNAQGGYYELPSRWHHMDAMKLLQSCS